MITQLSHPPTVAMAGNPIVARLATNNHLATSGAIAVFLLRFSAEEANNRTFLLTYNGISIQFTFKLTPDLNSSTELPLKGASSLSNWMDKIAAVLKGNYILIADFDIYSADHSGNREIFFKARKMGAAFNISYTAQTSENGESLLFQTGTDRTFRPNFRLLMQPFKKSVFDFQLMGEDRLPVNDEGETAFQIDELLREDVMSEFLWPENYVKPWSYRNRLAQPAFMRFAEVYGTTEAVQRLGVSPEFVVMQGNIPRSRLNEFQASYGDPGRYFATTKRFMSWQPDLKYVYPDQPEKLYFFAWPAGITQAKLEVTIVRTTGVTTSMLYTVPVSRYNVVEFITSPAFLASDIHLVEEIRIRVLNQSNVAVSITQTYIIRKDIQPERKYFLYRNSWGAFESVCFTGEQLEEAEYTRPWVDAWALDFFDQKSVAGFGQVVDATKLVKANSGFTTDKEVFRWMEELLLSRNVYEVNGSNLEQIRIADGKVFRKRTEEDVLSLQLEYSTLPREHVFFETDPALSIGLIDEPVIDPSVPVSGNLPVPKIIKGLNEKAEYYFPGNAYVEFDGTGFDNTDQQVMLILMRPEKVDMVLLSSESDSSRVEIDVDGMLKLTSTIGNTVVTNFEPVIGNYQLLEILIVSQSSYEIKVNGITVDSDSFAFAGPFNFTRFGYSESKKYFKGSLNSLLIYDADEIGSTGIVANRLKLANEYAVAAEGAAWLTAYDDLTAKRLVVEQYTRDEVREGVEK